MTGTTDSAAGDVIVALVDLALESVGGERARLFVCDGRGLRLRAARSDTKEDLRRPNRDATALAEHVVRKRRSLAFVQIRTTDLSVTLFGGGWGDDFAEFSVMAAPVLRGERILGVLYVEAKAEQKRFADEDLRVVEAIADRLAAALPGAPDVEVKSG